MTLRTRIARIEARVAPRASAYGRRLAAWREQAALDRAAFLAHVPEDLRQAVAAAAADPGREEEFAAWTGGPFARWAGPTPTGFVFPRAMVEWMLAGGEAWCPIHHCGGCGLTVPIRMFDPAAPLRPLAVFPACPACGGAVTYAAGSGPAPARPGERP